MKNQETFLILWDLITQTITHENKKKILMKVNKNGRNPLHSFFRRVSSENDKIQIFEIFKNVFDLEEFKNILLANDSSFKSPIWYSMNTFSSSMPEVLLRLSFDTFGDCLKVPSEILFYYLDDKDIFEEERHISRCLVRSIEEWQKVKEELLKFPNLKNFLKIQFENRKNFLHAAFTQSEEIAKDFYNFLIKFCDEIEVKKMLSESDNFNHLPLHYSARAFFTPNPFDFVIQKYKEIFTRKEIENILNMKIWNKENKILTLSEAIQEKLRVLKSKERTWTYDKANVELLEMKLKSLTL
jgi:hypothetical protein